MRLIRILFVLSLLFVFNATLSASAAAKPDKAQVGKLVAVLKSDAPQKEKADACRELASVGSAEAVAPLAALLDDEQLSHMARYGLEAMPSAAAGKALREALGRLHGRSLAGVISSVGARRDTKAVKPLASLLQDADPEVAQAAARALGSIGNPAAAAALQAALPQATPATRLACCEGLLRCAEALAADRNTKAALAIYDQVRGVQAPHQVRTAALRGAVLTRGTGGMPLLLEAMRGDDFALYEAAMRIAQEMRGVEVTRTLAAELETLPPDKQLLLVQTLGERGDSAALPALFSVASRGQKPVRMAAIRALPRFGSTCPPSILAALLGDSDQDIAQAAQQALGGLPGKDADAAVLALLKEGPPARRVIATELTVRRRMTSAVPTLLQLANEPEPKVRVAAIKRLGELAGPEQIPALLTIFDQAKAPEELEAAEQTLTAVCVKDPKVEACADRLAGWFYRVLRPEQKCALLRVLTAVGGTTALKTVNAAVNERAKEVHLEALRSLGNWNSIEAAPDLLSLARKATGPIDKMLCLRGYLRLAGQADLSAEKRLSMCRDVAQLALRDEETKLLLGTLGGIHSLPAFEFVVSYCVDPESRQEAVTAALNIADKLLEGGEAAKLAPKMVPSLEKVAQVAEGEPGKRAKAQLERAQAKAAGK